MPSSLSSSRATAGSPPSHVLRRHPDRPLGAIRDLAVATAVDGVRERVLCLRGVSSVSAAPAVVPHHGELRDQLLAQLPEGAVFTQCPAGSISGSA